MNKVLVFVEWRLDLNFFLRFINGLHLNNYEMVFFTNSLSLYLIGISKKIEIFLCRKSKEKHEANIQLNSIEILAEWLSEDEAWLLYTSVFRAGIELIDKYGIKLIFIPNGSSTAQIAMKNIAEHFNIPALFFENPNIPGKTIIDPKGVNAKSSLYGNIQILNDYNVNIEEYEKFISEYVNTKKITSQNRKTFIISIDNPYIVLDYLGFTFFNLPKNQNFSLPDRIIRKYKYRSLRTEYDKITFQDAYVFYPLQVSRDSQLLLNSDVSIMDALEYSYNESQKRGLKLIVKPHPKERDTKVIRKIMALRKQMKFLLTNLPTMDLVRHCELLIAINSTVGLEAMIMGKSVIFLGRTLYKDLSPDLVPRYICGYLSDFPYTSVDDVPVEKIAVLLRKIEVKSV